MLTLVEYILLVPDSIARLPGRPAGFLASDSGKGPRIEPNHTQAPPDPLLAFGAFLAGGVAGLAGAASSAAGGGGAGGGALPAASATGSSSGAPPPPALSSSDINNHCAFEVLGLGASACSLHRLNLLIVGCEGVEQLLAKDSRLLLLEDLKYHFI
jgi:hypothetical protein